MFVSIIFIIHFLMLFKSERIVSVIVSKALKKAGLFLKQGEDWHYTLKS